MGHSISNNSVKGATHAFFQELSTPIRENVTCNVLCLMGLYRTESYLPAYIGMPTK